MTIPDTIDFQSEEWRWAAQMACDEASVCGYNWRVTQVNECNSGLYALALRIARTEQKPVDPIAEAFDEVMGHASGLYGPKLINALHARGFEIAALKEGRGL